MARSPTSARASAAATDRPPTVNRLRPSVRRNVARSPAAAAADSVGKTAIENAAPMRFTGTLWKFRAKLRELTVPAPSVRRQLGEEQERDRVRSGERPSSAA